MIVLFTPTDGRNHFADTWRSAGQCLIGTIDHRVIVDDSCDLKYNQWLRETYQGDRVTVLMRMTGDGYPVKLGFGGAITTGWSLILDRFPECTHIFHLEDDFVFNKSVDLQNMVDILDADPWLAQLVLKRQAWNEEEKAAGGIVEAHPERFTDNGWYTEHSAYFSTNPCMYRRDIAEWGWPEGDFSEGKFGLQLKEKGYHFGLMGKPFDPPRVHHIGHQRIGTGY